MSTLRSLFDLGFIKNTIFESIVSTYNKEGTPNAAPMGIMTEDMNQLIMRPYTQSNTYKNLILHRYAVLNITSNPVIYYKTAIKENNLDNLVSDEWFEKSSFIYAPKIKNADAYIEVKIVDFEDIDKDIEGLKELLNGRRNLRS